MGKSVRGATSTHPSEGLLALAAIVERVLAEPKGMARQAAKSSKRSGQKNRRAHLAPDVYERFTRHFKSGDCLCSSDEAIEEKCGEKAAADGRGLSEKCRNKFKGAKQEKRTLVNAAAAEEFDIVLQEQGKVFPPRFSPNEYREAYAAAMQKQAKEAVKS